MELLTVVPYLAMAVPDISASNDAISPTVIERFASQVTCENFIAKIDTHGTMSVRCVRAEIFLRAK